MARTRRFAGLRPVLLVCCLVLAMGLATPAAANPHDPERGGHPLRVAAYLLHPVGYFLDVVLVRPAHWLISRDSLAPIFGHPKD